MIRERGKQRVQRRQGQGVTGSRFRSTSNDLVAWESHTMGQFSFFLVQDPQTQLSL